MVEDERVERQRSLSTTWHSTGVRGKPVLQDGFSKMSRAKASISRKRSRSMPLFMEEPSMFPENLMENLTLKLFAEGPAELVPPSPISSSLSSTESAAESEVDQEKEPESNQYASDTSVDGEWKELPETLEKSGPPPCREKERCFICYSKFSKKSPPIPIPCLSKCNNTPVHARCIYEWMEMRNSIGQQDSKCPLCRGQLHPIAYLPQDPLKTTAMTLFGHRKSFVTKPVPRSVGMVRCYLRIVREEGGLFGGTTWYEMYLQGPVPTRYPHGPLPSMCSPAPEDKLVLVARQRPSRRLSSVIDISVDTEGRNFKRSSPFFVGCVKSSMSGLDHSVLGPCTSEPAPSNNKSSRSCYTELAAVKYSQNRVGKNVGPRKMRVTIPKLVKDNCVEQQISAASHGSSTAHQTHPCPVDLAAGCPQKIIKPPSKGPAGERKGATAPVPNEDEGYSASEDEESSDDEDEEIQWSTCMYRPPKKSQSMRNILRKSVREENIPSDEKLLFGYNKQPYWLDSIQAYSLDFSGRVTLPSNKNFQLVFTGQPERNTYSQSVSIIGTQQPLHHDITLQFGKVNEDGPEVYTMDFQWPLSPVQAFGMCISACVYKFACA